jgi:hypothetical protein
MFASPDRIAGDSIDGEGEGSALRAIPEVLAGLADQTALGLGFVRPASESTMTKDWEPHFFDVAKRWVDDAYVTKPTDAAGLAGMLREGVVWATDYRFLNDSSEIEHTRKITRDLISDKLFGSDDGHLKDLYQEAIRFQREEVFDYDVFVFSLSQEKDDLSQWRGYARDGMGFTVGFCGTSLNDATSSDDAMFSFFEIEYDHESQVEAMERAVAAFEKEALAMIKAESKDAAGIVKSAAKNMIWCSQQRAAVNKHQSFRGEREWRILSYVNAPTNSDEVRSRVSGQRLVNYTELRLGHENKLPILSIGIGPGFRSAEQEAAVRSLCRDTGYSPDIYSADTPYRRP